MTTIYTSLVIKGEIIIFRLKRTHCQVNANLILYYNLEHMAALSPPLLLVELRCNIEEGQTHFSPCKTIFYGEETKLGVPEEMSCLLKKHCSDSDETMFCTSLDIPTCETFPELEFATEGNNVWL